MFNFYLHLHITKLHIFHAEGLNALLFINYAHLLIVDLISAPVDLFRNVLASQSMINTLQNAVVQVIDGQNSGDLLLDFIMELVSLIELPVNKEKMI